MSPALPLTAAPTGPSADARDAVARLRRAGRRRLTLATAGLAALRRSNDTGPPATCTVTDVGLMGLSKFSCRPTPDFRPPKSPVV